MWRKQLHLLAAGLILLGSSAPELRADSAHEESDERKFSIHGEVRFRGEFTGNFSDFDEDGLDASGNDDDFDFFPYRARLGIRGQFARDVSGYVEIQTADAAGLDSERRDVLFSNDDDLDLYQGHVRMDEIGGTPLALIIGRQELVFDNEFLLGDLDFYNGISHDGVRAHWDLGAGELDAFGMRLAETFEADADTDFLGAHYTWDELIEDGDVAVYGYYLRDDAISGIRRSDLYVLGGRSGRDLRGRSGFIWNGEVAFQFGDVGNVPGLGGEDADISAFGGEGMFGYNWSNGVDQRVFGRVYFASGDDDPTDDDVEAFNPLFQDFHGRLGIADAVSGSNVTAASVGYGVASTKHRLGVELFQFTLSEEVQDADVTGITDPTRVGHASGSVPGRFDGLAVSFAANGEDDLGQELDVVYDYDYSKNLAFGGGLAYFVPGDVIEDVTGIDDEAVRLYGQARLRF